MDAPRILIVEDDAIQAAHLEETLIQLGYQSSGLAATGRAAVDLALKEKPDAILMDIRLRGKMTGIQAAEEIHKQAEIPIVYLTAYTDETLLQQAKITDAYAYLAKPVRDRELRASLEMALYKYATEQRLHRLNQVLRAVRDINQLITRERDQQRLMEEACGILVRTLGYRLVWIGRVESEAEQARVVARAGEQADYLDELLTTWDKLKTGKGPAGSAVRTRQPCIFHDLASDIRYKPWRDAASKHGLASTAAVPMLHARQLLGVLCAYADSIMIFDEEVVNLLQEVASDLAFAIHSLQQQELRLKAEQALMRIENMYRRAITQTNGVPYQRAFNNDKFVFLGDAFENLTGYTPQEMTGKLFTSRLRQIEAYGKYKDLSHPERIHLARQGAIKEWREDYLFERKDGTLIWLSDRSVPLHDEAGKVNGSLGILLDITERKKADEAQRESEEKFRTFIEQASEGFVLLDEQGFVIEWNQAQEKIWGVERGRAVGKPFWELQYQSTIPERQTPERREYYKKSVLDALQTGQSTIFNRSIQAEICRPDGERRFIEQAIFPVMAGQGIRIGSVTRDITERKQAEEMLARQTEELHQRNEELGRLYRASGSLVSSMPFDLQTLSQTILEVILQEFGQTNCSVFLVQKDSNELKRMTVAGPYADQVSKAVLTLDGTGLVPQAIRTGRVINTPDVRLTPAYIPNWEAARSELTIPLKIGGQVIGAIDVQSADPNAFKADDERLMSIFAERAALSLEHARLYEQTEHRMQNLVSMRTIDMAISSSFNINVTLGILLDELIKELKIHAADILVFNPVLQIFQYSCGRGFYTQTLQYTTLRLSEGYAGRAARERTTIMIHNLDQDQIGLHKPLDFSREGFVTYVGVPLIAKGQIKGVLELFQREPLELDREQSSFLEMLAGQAAIAIDNAELFEHLQDSNAELTMAYDETIEGWSRAMDLRDTLTEGHSQRVTETTLKLANSTGFFSVNEMAYIRRGALLHDIGKMGIPDSILRKPGPLSEKEWEVMRKHPRFAYDMLAPIAYLRSAIDIPYCHHEKWDGTGYPRGLKGEQIPLAARIFTLVDVWDALLSDRPYRKAWPEDKVRTYLHEQAGRHFDPRLTEVFLGVLKG